MEQPSRQVFSMAIDAYAEIALAQRSEAALANDIHCDACDERIEGEPAGHGLYIWTRGDETRYEEPPLCALCATAIGITALAMWTMEEEEG